MTKIKVLKKITALCLSVTICFGLVLFAGSENTAAREEKIPIYLDYENYSFEERAADLTARLTLQQRLNQMISSYVTVTTPNDNVPTGVKAYGWWNEALHGISRIHGYTRNNPTVITNTTSYPNGFAMGQTWDPELQYRVSTQISDETREVVPDNDRMLTMYSPTVNLARDPRWGRTDETFGEDPYHTAMMASQFVNGLEGKNMNGDWLDSAGYQKAASTIKHYLANNSETNRLNGTSNLTEQELREYYSYVYRLIIQKTNVTSVMSAYNRIRVTDPAYSKIPEMPGGINQYTLDTLLRQTFGFTGYVTADCDSVHIGVTGTGVTQANQTATTGNGHGYRPWAYTNYGYPETPAGTAAITYAQADSWAIMGGAELECNTGYGAGNNSYESTNTTQAAINSGYVTPFGRMTANAVDIACAKLLEVRMRLGEFDDKTNYYAGTSQENVSSGRVRWYDEARARLTGYGLTPQNATTANNGYLNTSTNHQTATAARLDLAREAAAKSQVLLKNDVPAGGTKPLLPVEIPSTGNFSVGVYGYQATQIVLGGYSSNRGGTYNAQKQTNPYNGIRDYVLAKNPNATVDFISIGSQTGTTLSAAEQNTISQAGKYDLCVVVIGDYLNEANEGADRTDIIMRGSRALIPAAVMAVNPKTVACLTAYTPLYLNGTTKIGDTTAILYSGFGGDSYGGGLADVIFGAQNPSARTSTIWANSDATDTNTTSFNNRRSYRLSPGVDGPYQNPTGHPTPTGTYTYGETQGRTYMYYNGPELAYPLGYGLSYTTFEYSNLRVSGATPTNLSANPPLYSVGGNGTVTVEFDVKNTGSVAGADVAQLYVKTPESLVNADKTYAVKRLKGFEKTKELQPGETQTITLSVPIKDLMFYSNTNKRFELARNNGAYQFQISRNSNDSACQLAADINITSDHVPGLSVLTFKANTLEDATTDNANHVPQRLQFAIGDTVNPNPTACMTNDVLYGYINKGFFLDPASAMPSSISITYSSNRPQVVSVSGGTIKAVAGGVATITGTAFDSVSGTSVQGHFVVYVQGEALDHDVSLASVSVGGTSLNTFNAGVTEFDANVAKGVVTPSMVSAVASYTDKVDVVVTQATTVPGSALITVTSKEIPDYSQTYKVNFGYMTVSPLLGGVDSSGWTVGSEIRFSDGQNKFKLLFAAFSGDDLVFIKQIDYEDIPLNAKGQIGGSLQPPEVGPDYSNYTYKVYLWDDDYTPLTKQHTAYY